MNKPPLPAQADTFHATGLDDLPALTDFMAAMCQRADADADATFAIRLAVEETFANIVHHGYAGQRGPIAINVDVGDRKVVITLTDQAPVFDPFTVPEPDIDKPIEGREPGGLGLHLIRQMVDEASHASSSSGGNVVTLVKRFRTSEQES